MPELSREEVYRIIDSEREYQKSSKGNAKRTDKFVNKPLTPGEILLCMEEILSNARTEWYKPEGWSDEVPNLVRKVTALGVQYMENYGAKERK